MYKYEMHTHTAQCDKYAKFGGGEIVALYKEAGYSGIVITDHYFAAFYDWFKNEIDESSHKSIINRYLKGYYAAREQGEKLGVTVLCGAEVRLSDTDNDYLVYGLEEEDFYNLPLLNRLSNIEELSKALPPYALLVQAHPFRDEMTVLTPENIFGIEGYNGANQKFRNDLAKLYANHYGKTITSGSDFHEIKHLARGGIIAESKINNSKDLVNILKSGKFTIIETES